MTQTKDQNKTVQLRESEKIRIELEAKARLFSSSVGLLTRKLAY